MKKIILKVIAILLMIAASICIHVDYVGAALLLVITSICVYINYINLVDIDNLSTTKEDGVNKDRHI